MPAIQLYNIDLLTLPRCNADVGEVVGGGGGLKQEICSVQKACEKKTYPHERLEKFCPVFRFPPSPTPDRSLTSLFFVPHRSCVCVHTCACVRVRICIYTPVPTRAMCACVKQFNNTA